MMTGHTKEPWRAEQGERSAIVLHSHAKQDYYANRVAVCPQWARADEGRAGADEAHANARRIVDCVNALAGIPDPLAFVQAARGCVEALEGLYDHSLPAGPIGDDDCDEALRALRAFRAATGEA